ncbi:MAG TPA: class I SAM-dependent methyltransferase, partial [Anaerolinea sp.]|nr:class I SAM-dependent methyltransferase [Anaerolinea sp.]
PPPKSPVAGGKPPPPDGAKAPPRHESNRLGWNEGAAVGYTPAIENTIAFLRAGGSNLHPVERTYLAEILPRCDLAIHLQCASGRDTLSLLNEGVKRVVGVDISDVHIENARRTSQALGAAAEWVRSDLLDTPHTLDGTADLVYTGRGALCWLMDLDAWAQVVARLLKPGGVVSIFDGHPITWLFKQDAEPLEFFGYSYFPQFVSGVGWPNNYIGETGIPPEQQARKYECSWTLANIFTALTRAGLVVEHFGEHPEPYWEEFPNLKPELLSMIPSTFSMLARKP